MIKNEATGRTDSGMEHFGYRESLDRSIGAFGSFAAGVSYISILTGTFQLFYFGFATAGPAHAKVVSILNAERLKRVRQVGLSDFVRDLIAGS